MSKLAQLRAQIGPAADGLTDQELFEVVQEVYTPLGADPKRLQQQYGYDPEWDFGRGLRIAGRNTLAAGAGALAAGADAFGFTGARDSLLEYGRGQQQQAFQMGRRSDDVDNFTEDPLSFLSAGAGQAVGYALPSLVGGGIGAGAARMAGMRALGGAAAGSYAVNLGQETGGIYNELAEQGRFEPGRALVYGAGAAALDTAAEAVPFLRAAPKGGLMRRVATGGLTQAGVEAGTETAQTAIERAGAYKDLTGPEAWHEYRNAAALGAIGGGMFGGGMAVFPGGDQRPPAPVADPDPGTQTDVLQLGWSGRREPEGGFGGQPGQTPFVVFPDGSTATQADAELMQRYGMSAEQLASLRETEGPRVDTLAGQGTPSPVDLVGPAPQVLTAPRMEPQFTGFGNEDPNGLGDNPYGGTGLRYPQPLGAQGWDPGFPQDITEPDVAGTLVADEAGAVATGPADAQALYGRDNGDPGLALARERYLAAERARQAQAQEQAAVQAKAEEQRREAERAQTILGGKIKPGSKAVALLKELEAQRDAGVIDQATFESDAALLSNSQYGLVRKNIAARNKEQPRVPPTGTVGGAGAADLGRGVADQRAPGQPGDVRPAGTQPAAQAVAGERADGVRPGVAGSDDALTGPNLAGKFVERVQQLDPESQAYLSRWLGVEMDEGGQLTLRQDGAESLRTMASTLGVSYETVRARLRQALRRMGLPETVQAQDLYEDLGLSAAGTDLDTVTRTTQGEPDSGPNVDALDAVEEVADDTALGGVGDTQVRALAPQRGPMRVGDDADAPLLSERPDDDPTGRVREISGPIDEGSLAAEDRIDEARALTLDDALETDVSAGRVVADDIDEARFFYDQNRQRGMQPWSRLSVLDQATAVRLYARARLAGDPLVLATKRALYEGTPRTDGRSGPAADAGSARGAQGGTAEGGDAAADAGDAGDQQAQYQVPAARGSVPVVTKRKRRAVRPPPDEDVTWGDQLASAEQGGVALDRSRTQATTREQVLAQAPFGKAAAALRALGLGHVLDWVGEWRTADSDPNVAEGWLEGVGARYALTLKPADAFRTSVEAEWTFAHEIGHAADLAVSGGVYSAHPDLAFDIDGDQAVGRGAVAAELAELYENDPFWSSVLAYPLDVRYYGTADGEVVSAEVFAQLFAMYVRPKGRTKLQLDAPLAFQFIQESVNDIQASRPLAIRTPGEVKGRAQAFARRYRGVSSAQSGVATQGSRGGSGASDRSSARPDVGPRLSKSNPAAAEVVKLEDARKAIRESMAPKAQDALTNIGDAVRKYGPYLLSNFQLMEQFGNKIKTLGQHLKVTDLMVQESTRQQMAYDAIAKRWEALPTAARELLDQVTRTATLRAMHPDRAFTHEDNAHLKPAMREEHARLKAEYDRMARTFPAAAQVYQDALKQLEASWDAQAKAIEQLYQKYNVKRPELKKVPGPYFPLMRFGEYLAVAKSREFMDLEDQIRTVDDPTTRAEALKILAEMKRDPKHYVVSAHETRAAQERALRKLEGQGSFVEVRAGMANQRLDVVPRDVHATITELATAMGKQFDPTTVEQIQNSLSEMLLRTLPEAHALERQAQRAGVEGATTDMLRAFAAAGRQNAFYTARTLHAKDLAVNMDAMKSEVKGNVDLMHVHREIEKRVALDLRFRDTPVQNFLSTVSWIYNLGVSPTFLAMNALQPALVTYPTLAAKFGPGAASRELSRAWKEALGVLKDARFKDGKWDAWAGISEESVKTTRRNAEGVSEDRKALRELMQRGIVDEGLVHDMGRLADGQSGLVERVAKYTGWASQQIELANRVSTALATFRLARDRGLEYDAAVEEAYRSTVKTQIDYSAEGAPRFMREGGGVPLAKLVFQFRRYQQGMFYLLGSNIRKAYGSGPEAVEARKVLAYFAASSGLAAGALGMPFAGTVMWLLNAFMDDDDERGDAQTRFRNLLVDLTGDRKMAEVLAKGLPALWGMDLSARIGMGDVASPLPRLEMAGANTSEDKIGRLLTNVAGPTAGLGVRMFDAASYWSQGDLAKGLERALPKAAGDVIQSMRLATQGMTDRKGEQILGPGELDAWDKLYRALGTTPTVQSNYYEANNARRTVERAVTERKADIRVQFRKALRDGNMTDVRALIDEYNRDHPDTAIKPKDEVAWRREAARAEAQRGADGIKFNPRRDQRYEELMRFARG